jgi:hypothetical protein
MNTKVTESIKGKFVPVHNPAVGHEDVWVSGCPDPSLLDLGTSCSHLDAPAGSSLGKAPSVPIGQEEGGPQCRSW